jgi:hypothetical protein
MKAIIESKSESESVDRDEYRPPWSQREGVAGWKLLRPNGWEDRPGVSLPNRVAKR